MKVENPRISDDWNLDGVTKVVGYRFRVPGEDSKGRAPDGSFSLCHNSTVDLEKLQRLKVKSVVLNSKQVEQLVDLLFSNKDSLTSVACYSPHQLFIFYDSEGDIKNFVEICFLCNGVKASPLISGAQKSEVDLMGVAKLCHELGIWADYEKFEDYAPLETDQWRQKKKAKLKR